MPPGAGTGTTLPLGGVPTAVGADMEPSRPVSWVAVELEPVALEPVAPELLGMEVLPLDVPELAPMPEEEPELMPVPCVPHAARTSAQARGIVHFNI